MRAEKEERPEEIKKRKQIELEEYKRMAKMLGYKIEEKEEKK